MNSHLEEGLLILLVRLDLDSLVELDDGLEHGGRLLLSLRLGGFFGGHLGATRTRREVRDAVSARRASLYAPLQLCSLAVSRQADSLCSCAEAVSSCGQEAFPSRRGPLGFSQLTRLALLLPWLAESASGV